MGSKMNYKQQIETNILFNPDFDYCMLKCNYGFESVKSSLYNEFGGSIQKAIKSFVNASVVYSKFLKKTKRDH